MSAAQRLALQMAAGELRMILDRNQFATSDTIGIENALARIEAVLAGERDSDRPKARRKRP